MDINELNVCFNFKDIPSNSFYTVPHDPVPISGNSAGDKSLFLHIWPLTRILQQAAFLLVQLIEELVIAL